MHLKFLHVFSCLDNTFLISIEQYCTVWMYHSLFIHSPTKGHPNCFQVLVIINKAAINNSVQVFLWTYVLNTKDMIAVSFGKSMFSFARNCQTGFQSVCTILHRHQRGIRVPLHVDSKKYNRPENITKKKQTHR